MVDPRNGLNAHEKRELLAEIAVQYARLELEKLAQHILDLLKFGDEGLAERIPVLDSHLAIAKAWIVVYNEFVADSDVDPIPQPIPDQGQ
jgi:hypothetical protein